MIGSGSMHLGDMPPDLEQKVRRVCVLFEQAVQKEVEARKVVPVLFPALFPCNMLTVIDSRSVHVVFSNVNTGGLPVQKWLDRRTHGPVPASEVVNAAVVQHAIVNPAHFEVVSELLDWPEHVQVQTIVQVASQYVEQIIKAATRPQAIPGYEGLQPLLDKFSDDHPEFSKNVFIAMRFRPGKQFLEIHEAVKSGLAKYGLKGLRSDDKTYPPDGDLWTNICVYMMGCKFGICVFEEIDEREFNPNVPLEYGFMRAMNRQVLLLKDLRMPKTPSDMTGKLYRNFDSYSITLTIHEQIGQWVERDLGLKAI